MEQPSDYELAQRRIEQRERRRERFKMSLTLLIFAGLITLLARSMSVGLCAYPVMCGLVVLLAFDGLEVYYLSPEHTPDQATIEQQMIWLFGYTWREYTGTEEYALAQGRIRLRRVRRWYFFIHSLLFLGTISL